MTNRRVTFVNCPGSLCTAFQRKAPQLDVVPSDMKTSDLTSSTLDSMMVVLGLSTEHPLAVAHGICRQSPLTSVVMLARPEDQPELHAALILSPTLARRASVLSFVDQQQSVHALLSAIVPSAAPVTEAAAENLEPTHEAAQALLSTILDSNSIAVVTRTLFGSISCWSAGAERLFGYAAEEVLGQHIGLIVPEARAYEYDRHLAEVERGAHAEFRQALRTRKNGTTVAVSLSLQPLRSTNGKLLGVCELARELTLQELTPDRMEVLPRGSPVMLLSVQMNSNRIIDCNEKLLAELGYTKHQVMGSHLLELCADESREEATWAIEQFRTTGLVQEVELTVLRHEGAPVEVLMSLAKEAPLPGNNARYRVHWQDVTRRNAAERAVLDKDSQFQDFVYSVSHDLKAPLVTLHGFIDLFKVDLEEHRTPLPAAALESLSRIEASALRMQRLFEDVLALGRAGLPLEAPEHVNVEGAVRDVVQELENQLIARSIQFTVQELPPVHADPVRVRQIFFNLIINALEHGVEAQGQIVVGARQCSGGTEYFVRDSGPGILAKFHDAVFQLFRTLRPNARGTGAGLAIAARAAEAMGGTLRLSSVPGNCEFLVWLPDRSASNRRLTVK